jgi:hypothetical protein
MKKNRRSADSELIAHHISPVKNLIAEGRLKIGSHGFIFRLSDSHGWVRSEITLRQFLRASEK